MFYTCRLISSKYFISRLQILNGSLLEQQNQKISVKSRAISSLLPIVYHPAYSAPKLPNGHRFPMEVFRTIYNKLLQEKIATPDQIYVPKSLPSDSQLMLVHDKDYLSSFSTGTLDSERVRRIGFGEVTNMPILVERTKAEVAGTLLTAELALRQGLACNTAGGTHHAFPAFGSGYCILNDLAVTSQALLDSKIVSRILIVDLDVHQGDGTADIFKDNPSVFTFSVHCQSNFPTRKQKSDLDIGLPDGTGDEEYLKVVYLELTNLLQSFRPDLVLYDAGVDTHKDDALGKLLLTDEGLYKREKLVMELCLKAGVPVAGYTGGGYDNDIDVLAQRHCLMHIAASEIWKKQRL